MTAGWYGKLPALGDFAQRRLEQDFITHWDTWLQAVIVDSQRTLGGNWLATYLRAPVWRFMLGPGVVDGRRWSGILLPSVDRVGRYFPLTICTALPPFSWAATQVAALDAWLNRLEDAARACLTHEATVAGFEAALAAAGPLDLGPPPPGGAALAALKASSRACPLPRLPGQPPAFDGLAGEALDELLEGYSLWWDSDGQRAIAHAHLPSGPAFVDMLQGNTGA